MSIRAIDRAARLRADFLRARNLDDRPGALDLQAVLEHLGLRYEEVHELRAHDGRQLAGEIDGVHRVVRVVAALPPAVKRFTVAHEVGHYLLHGTQLHHRDLPGNLSNASREPSEAEANKFATHLLMPSELFRSEALLRLGSPLVAGRLTQRHRELLSTAHYKLYSYKELDAMPVEQLATVAAKAAVTSGPFVSLCDLFSLTPAAVAHRLTELELVVAHRPIKAAQAEVEFDFSSTTGPLPVAKEPSRKKLPLRAVALVGAVWDFRSWRRRIKESNWQCVEDDSPDAIEKLRSDPPCGVAVTAGFWKALSRDRWEQAVRTLAELSSLTLIRVQPVDGIREAFAKVLPETLLQRAIGQIEFTAEGQFTDHDLLLLQKILDLRSRAASLVFHRINDVSEGDEELLRLIAAERYEAAEVTVQAVKQAHYVLAPIGSDDPVFVKLGDARTLGSELERTRQCIGIVETASPFLRFHAKRAALVQTLISAGEGSTLPAPSIRDALAQLLKGVGDKALFFETLLPDTLQQLCRLSAQSAIGKARHLEAIVRQYESYRAEGVTWNGCESSPDSIDTVVRKSLESLKNPRDVRLVHGDMHLDNILLKNSRTPVLIDFANAGPGHPLFDFVRFELAIWTESLSSEDKSASSALVRMLLTSETITPESSCQFKAAGRGVALALQISQTVRGCLKSFCCTDQNWFDQYRAMHVLFALQAISSPENHYLSVTVFQSVLDQGHTMAR